MTHLQHDPQRIRIPGDVDRPDRLIANLTARQVAILAATGIVLWLTWAATRRLIPLPVFAAFAIPVAAAAITLAIGRWHGLPADQLLIAAARQQFTSKRRIPAPDGIPPTPGQPGSRLNPLGVTVRSIAADGTLDLGQHGHAVLASATAMSFALRTPTEREALTAGFGRYLNSLDSPIQILISAEPVDLTPLIHDLHAAAPGLPHPLLEIACRDHAAYLSEFAAGHRLLHRDVLLVLRQPRATAAGQPPATTADGDHAASHPSEAGTALSRLMADAATALAGAGVALTALDGDAAAIRLARNYHPNEPQHTSGQAAPDAVITAVTA